MARTVPKGQNRGPRDQQMAIYLSKEEVEALNETVEKLGFRSKSALIVFILEDLIRDGFSGLVFTKVGKKFAEMIWKSPDSRWAFEQLNPFRKVEEKAKPGEFEKNNPLFDEENEREHE